MNSPDVLAYFNKTITKLHGNHITMESNMAETRLEPYAALMFYFDLHTKWACFDENFVASVVLSPPSIAELVNKAVQHDNP